jgi:flagellar protein FliO/FliZ
MEIESYLRFFLALGVTGGLIMVFYVGLRRYLMGRSWAGGGRGRRLKIVEVVAVDSRRRAVLLRRDNVEHLIVIGGQNDLLVEGGIETKDPDAFTLPRPAQGASS